MIKKIEEMDEVEVAQLYKTVFDSPEAKLILEDLKNRCYMKTSTAGLTPYETYLKEGMRTVVLHIITQINMKPQESENV